MEKFVWLSQLSFSPLGGFTAAAGPGFATSNPGHGAHYTVAELRAEDSPGWLLSSTAVLTLTVANEARYVLLRRSADASVEPGKWQFPAGRCDLDELPLITSCRLLQAEVAISGVVSNWNNVRIRVGGAPCEYLTQTTVHRFNARFVVVNNTVECYYPMSLEVPAFDAVALQDNEPYGRDVRLLTREQVLELLDAGALTAPAALIAKAELR